MPPKPNLSFDNLEVAFAAKSTAELRKMYLIFATLNNNFISNLGIKLANIAFRLNLPIKGIMKSTMFGHFCGGETIAETIQACQKLADFGVESILDLSIEGKGDEESYDQTAEEIRQTLIESSKTNYMPFGVFKTTGLGDFNLMIRKQEQKVLTETEQIAFDKMKERVNMLCQTAHDLGLKILVDAEESWFQHTIDDLAYEAMAKYNTQRCVVYNTFQMYRHDSFERLKKAQEIASLKGYILGVKTVRGAYMEKERARATQLNYPSPIQPTKEATDRDYDAALHFCIENKNTIWLVSGSHNEQSNFLLTELMHLHQIDVGSDHVYFSQLYGMSDNISFNLAKSGFKIAKYVPYGPVEKVMPYLARRASENSSIAGQSSREFQLIRKEMERRK